MFCRVELNHLNYKEPAILNYVFYGRNAMIFKLDTAKVRRLLGSLGPLTINQPSVNGLCNKSIK